MLQKVFFQKAVFTLSLLFLSVALNAQCSTTGWKKFTQTEQSSIALKEDGTIWMWGANTSGIKGDGTNGGDYVQHPTQVGTASDWVDIAAGRFFALALKANGDLYGWGSGDYGCFGLGNTDSQYTPVKIAENVKSFSAGYYHTMIVKTDGTMWGTGYNDWGGLGKGDSQGYYTTWQQESSLATNWAAAAAGYYNSFGIKTDGTLWSCGTNVEGQTGTGATGGESDNFVQIGTDTDWKDVSCGVYHVLALKNDGKLFGWGASQDGRLGIVDAGAQYFRTPQPIQSSSAYTHIATSWDASALIKSDGTLYAMGVNHNGIIGSTAASTYNLAPQQVGSDSDWETLASRVGAYHFGAVKADTSIWAWGTDNLYQLGNGDGIAADSNVPTQVKCEDDGTMAVHDVVKDGVSVYPNPASDIVYVKSAQKPVGVVRIYSADGSLVKTIKPGNDGAVNISNLPAGVYILKTQNDAAGMKLLKK